MDEKEAKNIYRSAKSYAIRILKNQEDAEEIAQDVVLYLIEKPEDADRPPRYLVIDAIRRAWGRPGLSGSERSRFIYALRYYRVSITNEDSREDEAAFGRQYLPESHIPAREPEGGESSPLYDPDALERASEFLSEQLPSGTQKAQARREGVTEGAITHRLKKRKAQLAAEILWEKREELSERLEELEIEWLTL